MIRIMILDDDEMYLKKEKDITEQYFAEKNVDCTVTIYQNVEWFLLGLKEEKFDMYLLDIRMPVMDGLEVMIPFTSFPLLVRIQTVWAGRLVITIPPSIKIPRLPFSRMLCTINPHSSR